MKILVWHTSTGKRADTSAVSNAWSKMTNRTACTILIGENGHRTMKNKKTKQNKEPHPLKSTAVVISDSNRLSIGFPRVVYAMLQCLCKFLDPILDILRFSESGMHH